ncbi:hypothetical protein KQX54_015489 [Cotesia glomerata]|uniref:Uncharacterized protein n=1 Tax=Cotesia glomerata TaxID=32391 RepID=A0AAV7J560_COTGL|nr:hypothetical protein KQX54_015489 [Cotesia glomerata]
MATYRDLYEAFSKRCESELSKQRVQDNCNACWKDLKKQFSGTELNHAASTSTKNTSNDAQCVLAGPTAKISGTGCRDSVPVENFEKNREIETSVDIDDPQPINTCKLYSASIVATDSHCRIVHSRQQQSSMQESVNINCRRSQRIVAKIAKRNECVLCRTIHFPTGAEDAEWLEESEVPTDVPNEIPSTVTSDELPIVSDWMTWIKIPFTPDED